MMPAFSNSSTCSFMAACFISPKWRLACTTGFASSETFRRCSATCRGTPTMSAGVQANTSMFSCNNFLSIARVRSDIAGPRVTVCSGRMSCLECAGNTMNVTSSVLEFLPSESNTGNDICPRGKTASLQKSVSG
ncbi:hypothetical protein Hanom_Chr13g01196221 [Helianthus anomalus]